MKKIVSISVTALCLALLSNVALAALPGMYAGAGIGLSKQLTSTDFIFNSSPVGTTLEQSRQNGGLGGRVFAGFNFNEYFGLEGSYARFNDSEYKSTITSPVSTYVANLDYTMNTYNLVGKAYLPLGETRNFNLYALGGVAYVNSQSDLKETINNVTISKDSVTNNKFRPVYGLGASYDIPASNVTTNLEFSHTQGLGNVNTSSTAIPDANMLTFNVAYNFG
ncbi:MAG: outer membrane beta-barrel protein [Gammaproteobacteria bacterium]|nr:outer membrane beta-barrel protein [Gammaproteobacteria bacterium]